MSNSESTTYRLAAAMIEAASQARADSPDDCLIQDSASKLMDDAREIVRWTIGFIDGNDPRRAPSKEAE
jgi:hypothetical protein